MQRKFLGTLVCLTCMISAYELNIFEAIEQQKYDAVQQILEQEKNNPHFNINAKRHIMPNNTLYGHTPLTLAISKGNDAIITLLLEHQADPNIAGTWAWNTPLIRAVHNKNSNITRLLLQHGTDPNIRDEEGFLALVEAAEDKQYDVVQLLLAYGADPNLSDFRGRNGLWWPVADDNYDMVKLMLDYNADPFKRHGEHKTAYERAQEKKFDDLVKLFDYDAQSKKRKLEDQEFRKKKSHTTLTDTKFRFK